LYPDPVRTKGASEEDFSEIVNRLAATESTGSFPSRRRPCLCTCRQFELLALALSELIEGRKPGYPAKAKGLLGPDSPPPASAQTNHLDWFAFRDATRDVIGFPQEKQRVPHRSSSVRIQCRQPIS